MGLSHVVTAFTANLVALGWAAREIGTDTPDAPSLGQVPVYCGPEFLDQHDSPPRVVFVPGDIGKDKFAPTDALGGPTRQFLVRVAPSEVHVWGKDYAECEQLVNDTIVALDMACGKGNLTVASGGFVAKTNVVQHGREYVLALTIKLAVAKPTLQTAPSDIAATHKGKMFGETVC